MASEQTLTQANNFYESIIIALNTAFGGQGANSDSPPAENVRARNAEEFQQELGSIFGI